MTKTIWVSLVICGVVAIVMLAGRPSLEAEVTTSANSSSRLKGVVEQYVSDLSLIAKDPKSQSSDRTRAVVLLARQGQLSAYQELSEILKEKDPLARFFWASMIEKTLIDEQTIVNLLKDKEPETRMTGILLASILDSRSAITVSEWKAKTPAERRISWICSARMRDYNALLSIVAVAGDDKASKEDRQAARFALGAYVGVDKPLSPDEFKKKLTDVISKIGP